MSTDAVNTVSVDIAGTEISLETGKLAKQAGGSVVVRQGDTVVLCTATVGNLRDVDFLPLTVDVEERMYAAGKIPGSFFKREGRSGEKGTLTARMIDRPIRPLFPKGWHFETQLVAMPLSVDHVHPYDILAMNGASAALMLSEVPLPTPVGAVRVGKIDGNFVVNPTEESLIDGVEGGSDLDLIVAGTEEAILMVEAGANEIPEAEILDALDIAHDAIKKLCQAQRDLAAKAGKEKLQVEPPQIDEALIEQIRSSHGAALDAATQVVDKLERQDATKAVEEAVAEQYAGDPASDDHAERRAAALAAFAKLEKAIDPQPHRRPEEAPRRALGERDPPDHDRGGAAAAHARLGALHARPDAGAVASSRWARSRRRCGSTRSASRRTATTGTTTTSRPSRSARPASCAAPSAATSATARSPSARSCRSSRSTEDFPYTIRVVSDILESNGSSSMASVCGSSLSLMDAGVPIKAPVAGIAMGLIKEGDDYIVLTDIAGVEDHLGDMDFKVAGTAAGITALQMDIKITGVTFEILRDALVAGARGADGHPRPDGRRCIDAPRDELSPYAPRIIQIQIDPSQIGLLIGKGGETIRGLSDEFESQIDVNDEGQVLIYSSNGELGEALAERIRTMMKEVEVGDEFTGKVVKTTTFGAFVELTKGTDGLLHISNVSPGQRVNTVEEVLNRGDEIQVKVVEVDRERGRIGLRLVGRPVDRRQVQRGARGRRGLGRRPTAAAAIAARAGTATGAATAATAAWRARLRPPAPPARGQRP